MTFITERNKIHQESLDVVKKFEKAGGKIIKPCEGYINQGWNAPKPKNRGTSIRAGLVK